MKQKSVFIAPKLHTALRMHAAQYGQTMTDVVAFALRDYIDEDILFVADKTKTKKAKRDERCA